MPWSSLDIFPDNREIYSSACACQLLYQQKMRNLAKDRLLPEIFRWCHRPFLAVTPFRCELDAMWTQWSGGRFEILYIRNVEVAVGKGVKLLNRGQVGGQVYPTHCNRLFHHCPLYSMNSLSHCNALFWPFCAQNYFCISWAWILISSTTTKHKKTVSMKRYVFNKKTQEPSCWPKLVNMPAHPIDVERVVTWDWHNFLDLI